jgi:hypothetical protein
MYKYDKPVLSRPIVNLVFDHHVPISFYDSNAFCLAVATLSIKRLQILLHVPAQCTDTTVQWSGGQAPFRLLLGPTGQLNPEERVIADFAIDDGTSVTFPLSYTKNSTFLAAIGDATRFGSGGTKDIPTVGATKDTSCFLKTEVVPGFFMYTSPSIPQECTAPTVPPPYRRLTSLLLFQTVHHLVLKPVRPPTCHSYGSPLYMLGRRYCLSRAIVPPANSIPVCNQPPRSLPFLLQSHRVHLLSGTCIFLMAYIILYCLNHLHLKYNK